MPKVFGLHEVELPPDVTSEEYEQLFGKELVSLATYPGWNVYLLKGDRGERAGKFLLLFEIESVDARDRYYPGPEEESEEARRFWEQHPEAAAVLEKYTASLSEPHATTDYVVVGSSS